MSPADERGVLAAILRGLAAAAALAAIGLAWQYGRGAPAENGPPSVRVAKLPAGAFLWADAPADARYLLPGTAARDRQRLKLLVLRLPDGSITAFWFPQEDGMAQLPLADSPLAGGLACLDIAPDFAAGDIACRQAAPGFEFARRHRWSLAGAPLTVGTPQLRAAPGREEGGDWLLAPIAR